MGCNCCIRTHSLGIRTHNRHTHSGGIHSQRSSTMTPISGRLCLLVLGATEVPGESWAPEGLAQSWVLVVPVPPLAPSVPALHEGPWVPLVRGPFRPLRG